MNCPNEIADVLLEILARGVIQARSAGWSEKLELATLEADHVHNLPNLVQQFDPEKLAYYWRGERPSYISRFERLTGTAPAGFVELWVRLEALMPAVTAMLPEKSAYWETMEQIVRDSAAEFSKRKIEPDQV